AQRVRQIPPDSHQNDLFGKMRTLETDRHRLAPSYIGVAHGARSYLKWPHVKSCYATGEGSMGDAATPDPTVIPCNREAAALLDDYTLRMRYAWEQERRKGSGLHAIYARLAEQARKLALK